MIKPIKIGIGGPVGAGKTMLVEKLTKHLNTDYEIANYKRYLYERRCKDFMKTGVLSEDRIIGVETGGARIQQFERTLL